MTLRTVYSSSEIHVKEYYLYTIFDILALIKCQDVYHMKMEKAFSHIKTDIWNK
jgi:hypothetical protein